MEITNKLSLLTVDAIISFIEDSDFGYFRYSINDGLTGDTFHYKLEISYLDTSIGHNISVMDIYFYVDRYNDVVEIESSYNNMKLKKPDRNDIYVSIKQTIQSFVDNRYKKDKEILDNLFKIAG